LSFSRNLTPLCAALFALVLTAAGCAKAPSSDSPNASPPGAVTTNSTTLTPAPDSGTANPPPVGVHCGTERWPVKTLSDQDSGSVNFTPVQSRVADLRALAAPASLPQSSRITPTEVTVYSVTAQLVEFKMEDDRDIHLVIADPADPSATMITEFPDADRCTGAVASDHAQEMRTARAALVAAFGQPSSSGFTHINGTATVTGVGFFDFLHGQTGVASNGIELHPVIGFTASSGGAVPPPSTHSAATGTGTSAGCDPAYPTVCIPPPPPDLDCNDIPFRRFTVLPPDPHRFDGDHDGIGCES